jgi:hypothetical protein
LVKGYTTLYFRQKLEKPGKLSARLDYSLFDLTQVWLIATLDSFSERLLDKAVI